MSDSTKGVAEAIESSQNRPRNAKAQSSRVATSRKQVVNQTLSCAECRRLKLRCDRVFPCSSCQKRGIAELCPEGSLPTRNKPVASSVDKEQFYQQLSELRGRVLELEKALETAHSNVSSEPHPLLVDGKFVRKAVNKRKNVSNSSPGGESGENDGDETLNEALGSLHVGGNGRARFFGRSACVERLFKYRNNGVLTTPEEPNILVSAEVAMVYQSFPMLTIGEATGLVQERIWRHLPPMHRAQALRQSYQRHIYYVTNIIPENSEWFDDLFSRIYQKSLSLDVPLVSFSYSGVRMDELALLFAYFAMAALMDLELTAFNYEAEAYACLSRAALTCSNLLKHPTLATVETLVLLGYFESMWGEAIHGGDGWILTALATKLAQLIGIHLNSRQFGMEPVESERRRRVYWELYTLELMGGLSHGQPSTFSMIPSDVEIPEATSHFHAFRYRFAAECLYPLSKQILSIKMPTYTAVVELDRKIKSICTEFGIGPPDQSTPLVGLPESEAMTNYMKRVFRESTLLYLHRAFFVRAVAANPSDPQHTKYGLSVSRAYECAMALVHALDEVSKDHEAPSSRALLCWNHTLCSVFILGSITIYCPGSRLAPLAAKRLHDAEALYDRVAVYGGRASADKPFVSRMAEKCADASNAYTRSHSKVARGISRSLCLEIDEDDRRHDEEDDKDELAVLGGHTRLISSSHPMISSKINVSPKLSPTLEPPVVFQAHRNVSPLSSDISSIPESGSSTGCQWTEGQIPAMEISPSQLQGQGSSPQLDTTDHLASSTGSVSRGWSPDAKSYSANIPVLHDTFLHPGLTGTPLHALQTQPRSHVETDFENSNNLPDQPMALMGGGDTTRIVENTIQEHLPQGNELAPMEVSTDVVDPQEWSFADNWYNYVYSLDVFPPDYVL